MKKLIIILVFAFSLFSCSDDEVVAVFDKTAKERATENRQEFYENLNSSNWVIEMFPTTDQRYGGYSIYANFNEDYSVELFNELNANTPGKTSYNIVSRSGSVLTFNEFNNGIHLFSDPTNNIPKGYEGDYEFIYLKKEDNTIYTKGTKTRNDIRLLAVSETPTEYFTKINEVKSFLGGKLLFAQKPTGNYKFVLDGRFLTLKEEGKDDQEISLVYRPNGFRLYKPLKIGGFEVSEFTLNDDKTMLVSKDGNVEIIVTVPLIDFTKRRRIAFRSGGYASPSAVALFKAASDKNVEVKGQGLRDVMTLRELSSGTKAFLTFTSNFTLLANAFEVEYSAKDVIHFNFTNNILRWDQYAHSFFLLQTIEDKSGYKIEDFNTNFYKLTSQKDSDFWFLLTK